MLDPTPTTPNPSIWGPNSSRSLVCWINRLRQMVIIPKKTLVSPKNTSTCPIWDLGDRLLPVPIEFIIIIFFFFSSSTVERVSFRDRSLPVSVLLIFLFFFLPYSLLHAFLAEHVCVFSFVFCGVSLENLVLSSEPWDADRQPSRSC